MNHETAPTTTLRDVARKFIPDFLLQQRGIIRRLGPGAGRIYAGLRLKDVMGLRTENQRLAPPSTQSFVFVCFGNIMRSALAEFLMRKALREAGVDEMRQVCIVSAGLHASPGREAHPWAVEAAADLGISLATHRAKLLTREIVERADAVFAMDFQNKAELLTLYPKARGKIYMLSAYAEGEWKDREIPDPYLGNVDVTKYCSRQLETCIHNLLASTVCSSTPKEQPAPSV